MNHGFKFPNQILKFPNQLKKIKLEVILNFLEYDYLLFFLNKATLPHAQVWAPAILLFNDTFDLANKAPKIIIRFRSNK